MIMNSFKLLGLLAVFALLSACGSKLTADNFSRVKNNMTEEEVKELIGKPNKVESEDILGFTTTTYTYNKGETEATVAFINGKVTLKSGKFE